MRIMHIFQNGIMIIQKKYPVASATGSNDTTKQIYVLKRGEFINHIYYIQKNIFVNNYIIK